MTTGAPFGGACGKLSRRSDARRPEPLCVTGLGETATVLGLVRDASSSNAPIAKGKTREFDGTFALTCQGASASDAGPRISRTSP